MSLARLLESHLTSTQSASDTALLVIGGLFIGALMVIAILRATQITLVIGPVKIMLKKPRRRKRPSTARRTRR